MGMMSGEDVNFINCSVIFSPDFANNEVFRHGRVDTAQSL
jgi:hypothetical protein